MTPEQEWAWAAGLFEGEGCIQIHLNEKTGHYRRRLELSSTDEDVVRRFHSIVKYGWVTTVEPRQPHHKAQWKWGTGRWECITAILAQFLPLFGERRRAKAQELLAHPAQRHEDKTHCKRGHPYDEANTYTCAKGRRHCRACKREQWHERSRT